MKAHLLAYSQVCAPRRVQRLLNDTQAVETWVTPFPYAALKRIRDGERLSWRKSPGMV